MRKHVLLSAIVSTALIMMLAAPPLSYATVKTPVPSTENEQFKDNDQFKKELEEFFKNSGKLSPTALGDISKDPEALAKIREKIDKLTPGEISSMKAAFSQVPNWQKAPEVLSNAFQMEILSQKALEQAGDIEAYREEMKSLLAAFQLLPPDALAKLGLEKEKLSELQAAVYEMSPRSLALVQAQMKDQQAGLETVGARIFSEMPAELKASVDKLAAKGPLAQQDLGELDLFKADLEQFFDDLRQLPDSIPLNVDRTSLAKIESKLATAPPELLFVIKDRLNTPEMRQAMEMVRVMAGAADLTEPELAELESFRKELVQAYARSGVVGEGDAAAPVLEQLSEQLSNEQLLLARERYQHLPNWTTTVPVVMTAATAPQVTEQIKQIAQGTLSQAQAQQLEAFRAETLDRLAAIQAQISVQQNPQQHQNTTLATQAVTGATLTELAVMQGTVTRLPVEDPYGSGYTDILRSVSLVGTSNFVELALDPQVCKVNMGSIKIPVIDVTVNLGTLDFSSVCNVFFTPINAAVNFLESAVNAIEGVIDDVFTFLTQDIPNFFASLPGVLQSFFANIAQAALSAFSPQNIQNALGLAGDFWNNLPSVPQIPCPPDGFNLFPFGEVGDPLSASKFERYTFIFDTVLDIIPDTEISLAIKIPAQVLYGGVKYLGICLKDAATARSLAATDLFRMGVNTSLSTSLANQIILSQDLMNLQASVNAAQVQIMDLSSLMTMQHDDLKSLIGQQGADLSQQMSDFEEHVLKLNIEENLVQDGQDRIAIFQLPQAVGGQLEMVRDLVIVRIQQYQDAGLGTRRAEEELAQGEADHARGAYRNAYTHFRKAYIELVKLGGN